MTDTTNDLFAPTPPFLDQWLSVVEEQAGPGSEASIHQRIVWCQGLIGYVGKGGVSPKEGYSYRKIDDVLNALHIPLCKAGLYIQPHEAEVRVEEWTKWKNDNREFWVRMRYVICDINGNTVEIEATGNAINATDKGLAAAKSYAYKQLMSQLFSLPTDDPAMDVEHAAHDQTRRDWWENLGWGSEVDHADARAALIARSRELPERQIEDLKVWASSVETDNGPLYTVERKAFSADVSRDVAASWSDQLAELEEAADLAADAEQEPVEGEQEELLSDVDG